MKLSKEQMRLYAVTDRKPGKDLIGQIEDALRGGVTILQLREKDMTEEEFLKEAQRVKKLCAAAGVPFIINDSVEVAKLCDADGVHLGQDDMPIAEARGILGKDKIIGISAHNVEEAVQAEKDGADYLGSGAMFSTSTKNDVSTLAKEELVRICGSVEIPVVAIGGIGYDNICKLTGSGIAGVAVSSAVFSSDSAEFAARAMRILSDHITKQGVEK